MLRIVFVVLLVVWSWLLVKPQPVPELLLDGALGFDRETIFFILAKSLHLGVYTFFALYGCWLAPTPWHERLIAGGLILHGIASELGQMIGNAYFETHRHGCIRDMLIDTAGVLLGAGLIRYTRRRSAKVG